MRKSISISFLIIHLFANTEAGELFKIPRLVDHYFEHNRIDPALRFFDFLAMHYGEGDNTTADDSEDQKLPYQNPNTHCLSPVYSAILKPFFIPEIFSTRFIPNYANWTDRGDLPGHPQKLLQPPRA